MVIMKKKVLYLHGFLSSIDSDTLKSLIESYGYKYEFIAIELNFADPSHTLQIINECITKEKPSLIIGNSLGGFYALICNNNHIPIIVINPCLDPYVQLKRHLSDGSITMDAIEAYKEYNHDKVKDIIKSKLGEFYALLSSKDEILGDSHIKFFMEVKEETKYKYMIANIIDDFMHRVYPKGMSWLRDCIDDIMYG